MLLHEFAHGLNFQTFYDGSTGVSFGGRAFTDIYARYLFDRTSGLTWPDMTKKHVAASAINFGNLVWSGDTVTEAVPVVLFLGSPQVDVLSPPAIAGPISLVPRLLARRLAALIYRSGGRGSRRCGCGRSRYNRRLQRIHECSGDRRQNRVNRTRHLRLRIEGQECQRCGSQGRHHLQQCG